MMTPKVKKMAAFVFDCRGILNPGRLEGIQKQNRQRQRGNWVLEQQTQMPEFLHSVFDVVDITVEDFIKEISVAWWWVLMHGRSASSVKYAADVLPDIWKISSK